MTAGCLASADSLPKRSDMNSKPLAVLDLFAGVGGFRIGAELCSRVRPRFVGWCEIDARATDTYGAMFDSGCEPHIPDLRMVTRLPAEERLDRLPRRAERTRRIVQAFSGCDLLTAGLPCQPHSLMGNRRGIHDSRGSLFYDVAEVIRALEPRYFILENVRALRSVNSGELYADMQAVLRRELGYNLRIWELNAADYGIPQVRRRLFFVGSRDPLPENPPAAEDLTASRYPTTWHLLERDVPRKYYLSSRILATVLKHQHKGYRRPAEINRLIARPLTRTMHKMHRASQDNYYSDDFVRGEYDPCTRVVLRAASGATQIRRITPLEAFRIQSFPEPLIHRALNSGVSDTQLYMQAGNAVPPQMVRAVLDHVFGG